MPYDLHDIDLDEVSIVDDGANQHAHIMLYKRGNFKTEYGRQFPMSDYAYVPDPTSPSTWRLRLTADPGGGPNVRIVGAAIAALGPTGFRGNRVDIPAHDLPKVKAKVLAAWKKLHPDAKELPASLTKRLSIREEREALKLYMFGKGGSQMTPEELEKRFTDLEGQVAKLQGENETLKKERDDALAALEKAKADAAAGDGKKPDNAAEEDAEGESDTEMKKALAAMPAALRKRMEDAEAVAKAQAEDIAKMKEEREVEAFVSKAKAKYANLPATSEELGKALRNISKSAPDHLETIEKALAAGDAAIKATMVEKGHDHTGEGGSALSQLEKMAVDIAKRDGITKEKAFVKAKDENPELWTQHRNEVRNQH